ncbi:ABC transporter ATP-binding protein [Nitratireductor aquimarinus]|uniref:ABC transporter ATP-binding protein n=1 Tax=Nitratireductor aquimarinus TaxID=889300 RepID=UPI001A8BFFC7|nr:ABC transporter ATP-binding protein [Nitratireductor aquimarinus]MBN8245767.1 ABC transporter ATP-binding protein [Nitratireductor aquimarinus]MBY6134147.1 ABC transporter ATP-binding protein [Nitratireductor aquimarinus]MCA1305239.1 ABC transporter ATP-binding protein [Nitratireductor aquimarinus]
MTDAVLDIRQLKTHFLLEKGIARAVDGLDLTVKSGQILCLVGESGSGKTVAGFSILGLVSEPGRIVSGEIMFKGEVLATKSDRQMSHIRGDRIAMIFQDPMMTLNPVLRIDDQMMEAILIHHPEYGRKRARERCLAALSEVGIPAPEARLRNFPHELSGGMRQRVAIAIALLNEPDLIIADEPTTALDVTIQAQILYLVRKLCRSHGSAFIWITHDLGVAAEIADRIAVMYAGRIVEEGPTDAVLDHPRHPYTEGLIRSLPEGQAPGQPLFQISGVTPSLLNLPKGCPFRPRCVRAQADCETAPTERISEETRYRCFHPANTPNEGSANELS